MIKCWLVDFDYDLFDIYNKESLLDDAPFLFETKELAEKKVADMFGSWLGREPIPDEDYWIEEKCIESGEHGKFLELPCGIGKPLWLIMVHIEKDKTIKWRIHEAVCAGLSFSLSGGAILSTVTTDKNRYKNRVPVSAIGETVFFTSNEAEKKLEELEG